MSQLIKLVAAAVVQKSAASGFFRALLILALVLIGLEARAQQQADQPLPPATLFPDIEVLATPYLWFP